MKFDLMAIILMIIAIAVGQFIGGYLVAYIGSIGGGIVGSLLTGLIVYVIYTFASKGKFTVGNAVIFAMLIYVANIIAAYASGLIGIGGGYLSLVIAGVFMALLWGWVGGKNAQPKMKAPKL
ncbi:MAG: hypothetical protein ABSA79_09145 [Candidatus Bathyarchaeia archaeon]|jgi:hypothetical protein